MQKSILQKPVLYTLTAENFVKHVGIGKYYPLSNESVFNFPEIKTIHKTLYGDFLNKSITFPKTFAVEIPNAYVAGNIGAVLYGDYFLEDTCIRKELLPVKNVIEIGGNVTSLVHMWAKGNYFHWLLNCMSRISLLEKSNLLSSCERFLVSSVHESFEKEGFDLIGINKTKLPVFEHWWKCEHLIATSPVTNDGTISQDGCFFLRNKFIRKINKDYPKKIAILRNGVRQIANKDKVYAILEKHGFVPIINENFSFREQIDIFSNAEYIFAPHGAGLANIVFCKPNTKILEVGSPCYINDCFRKIAAYVGLDYRFMMGEGEIYLKHDIPYSFKDIIVDVDLLEASLNI